MLSNHWTHALKRNMIADMSAKTTLLSLRRELQNRRDAEVRRRAMERQLAAYTTPSEVQDLLAMIEDRSGADADLMREVLTANAVAQARHQHLAWPLGA